METDARKLHERAIASFGLRVDAVKDDQWAASTPCSEWDVRALVNHIVYENRWMPPLLEGKTIAEIGDRFESDLLGDDPKAAWQSSAAGATAAVQADGAMDRTVHLSFGDFPGRDYTMQVFADLMIHGWDLARAIGADERLDPELVDVCAAWFAPLEEAYRSSGATAARPEVPSNADAQTRLLAAFGRA
jgi:uncharacterized protein (TIGR03086 family)